jgi:hypothetical protein
MLGLFICTVKKLILLLSFTVFLITGISATNEPGNTKLLSGKIIDKQTGETLAGVKVQLKGTDKYCYTDMNGNFVLTVNATNTAEVIIDMVGYQTTTLKTQELSLGSDIVLNPR